MYNTVRFGADVKIRFLPPNVNRGKVPWTYSDGVINRVYAFLYVGPKWSLAAFLNGLAYEYWIVPTSNYRRAAEEEWSSNVTRECVLFNPKMVSELTQRNVALPVPFLKAQIRDLLAQITNGLIRAEFIYDEGKHQGTKNKNDSPGSYDPNKRSKMNTLISGEIVLKEEGSKSLNWYTTNELITGVSEFIDAHVPSSFGNIPSVENFKSWHQRACDNPPSNERDTKRWFESGKEAIVQVAGLIDRLANHMTNEEMAEHARETCSHLREFTLQISNNFST
jgi:hypothetical protein